MVGTEQSILEEKRLVTTDGTVLRKTTDEVLAQAMANGGSISLELLEETIIAEMLQKSKENGKPTVITANEQRTS